MAKSIRAKSERANRNHLRAQVTGPHEAKRAERLASKMQETLPALLTDEQKRQARIARKKALKGEMITEEAPAVSTSAAKAEDVMEAEDSSQFAGKFLLTACPLSRRAIRTAR